MSVDRKRLTDAVNRMKDKTTSYSVKPRKYTSEYAVYNELVREDVYFFGTKSELRDRDVVLRSEARETFRTEKNRHSEAKADMIVLFRNDLAVIYNTDDNPKEQLLWDTSWRLGHSDGLHSVSDYYSDLVSLIE